MENKNKAEEIKKIETLLEVLNKHGSFIDLSDAFDRNTELCVLEAMGRYRQSEIDELTKEVDATFHELEGCREHVKQLQEEVERLRNHVLNNETINKIRKTITNAEARRIILTTH